MYEEQAPGECSQYGIRSTGSGGSVGNFAARAAKNTFVASRIELKGWVVEETLAGPALRWMRPNNLSTKARLKQDDLSVFDWDLTDRDQGNSDIKMMAFMRRSLPWFAKEFS